jgi:cytoskeleton protein RodZ
VFEIGNSLREARVRQGLDFPSIELATKIRGKYLRALEDEQFEILPAQTYVRGFLRTYAEYLGLDGQLYVDEFNSRYVVDSAEVVRPRRNSSSRVHQQRRLESRVLVLALLGIIAVTALVIVAWKFGGGNGSNVLPPDTASRNAPSRSTPIVPTSAHLAVRAIKGTSMLEVHRGTALGRALFAGTLDRGDPAQKFDAKRLWIRIAKPKAVRVTVNGFMVPLPRRGPLVAVVTKNGFRTLSP